MTPYVMKKQMSKYLGHTCSNSTALFLSTKELCSKCLVNASYLCCGYSAVYIEERLTIRTSTTSMQEADSLLCSRPA